MVITNETAVRTATNYVAKRCIEDEDLIQDIYLAALECVGKESSNPSAKIISKIEQTVKKSEKLSLQEEYFEDIADDLELINCLLNNKLFTSLQQQETNKILSDIIEDLPSLEGKVIKSSFGLGDEDPMLLAELAEMYGISYSRARQILNKGLRNLRKPIYRRVLIDLR